MMGKASLAIVAAALAVSMFVFVKLSNTTDRSSLPAETKDSDCELKADETWYDRYVKDHCERCPECCVDLTENEECSACPGSKCDCFLDQYNVWRPTDWLPESGKHCGGCPGEQCLCVKDSAGMWMLDETIGDE